MLCVGFFVIALRSRRKPTHKRREELLGYFLGIDNFIGKVSAEATTRQSTHVFLPKILTQGRITVRPQPLLARKGPGRSALQILCTFTKVSLKRLQGLIDFFTRDPIN